MAGPLTAAELDALIKAMGAEIERLSEENDALRVALRKYAQHTQVCPRGAPDWIDSDPCTCGISETLRALLAEVPQ